MQQNPYLYVIHYQKILHGKNGLAKKNAMSISLLNVDIENQFS